MHQLIEEKPDQTQIEIKNSIFQYVPIKPLIDIIYGYMGKPTLVYAVVSISCLNPHIQQQIKDQNISKIGETLHPLLNIPKEAIKIFSDKARAEAFIGKDKNAQKSNFRQTQWVICEVPFFVVSYEDQIIDNKWIPHTYALSSLTAKNIFKLGDKLVTDLESCVHIETPLPLTLFLSIKRYEFQNIYDQGKRHFATNDFIRANQCFSEIINQVKFLRDKETNASISQDCWTWVECETSVAETYTLLSRAKASYQMTKPATVSYNQKTTYLQTALNDCERAQWLVIRYNLEKMHAAYLGNDVHIFQKSYVPQEVVTELETLKTKLEKIKCNSIMDRIKNHYTTGELQAVIEHCNSLAGMKLDAGQEIEMYMYRGQAALFLEQFDLAVHDLKALVALREKNRKISTQNEVVYLNNQAKLAAAQIQAYLRANPAERDEIAFGDAQEILMNNEKLLLSYLTMPKYLQDIAIIKDTLAWIQSQMGFVSLHVENDLDLAVESFEKALKYHKNDRYANKQLGLIYFKQSNLRDLSEAKKYFAAHIEIKMMENTPSTLEAHGYLGLIYCEEKEWGKAVLNLQKAQPLGKLEFNTPLADALKQQKSQADEKQDHPNLAVPSYSNPAGMNFTSSQSLSPSLQQLSELQPHQQPPKKLSMWGVNMYPAKNKFNGAIASRVARHISVPPIVDIILNYMGKSLYIVFPKDCLNQTLQTQIQDPNVQSITLDSPLRLNTIKIQVFDDKTQAEKFVSQEILSESLICEVPFYTFICAGQQLDIPSSMMMLVPQFISELIINPENISMLGNKQVAPEDYREVRLSLHAAAFLVVKQHELQAIYDKGNRYLEEKNFQEAQTCFTQIIDQLKELEQQDDAQFGDFFSEFYNTCNYKKPLNPNVKYVTEIPKSYAYFGRAQAICGMLQIDEKTAVGSVNIKKAFMDYKTAEKAYRAREKRVGARRLAYDFKYGQYISNHTEEIIAFAQFDSGFWQQLQKLKSLLETIINKNILTAFGQVENLYQDGQLTEVVRLCNELEEDIKCLNADKSYLLKLHDYRGQAAFFTEQFAVAVRDFKTLEDSREKLPEEERIDGNVLYYQRQANRFAAQIQMLMRNSNSDAQVIKKIDLGEIERRLGWGRDILSNSLEEVADIGNDVMMEEMLAWIYSQLGFLALHKKDKEAATRQFSEAIRCNRKDKVANYQLGLIYYQQEKFSEAKAYFEAHTRIGGVINNTESMLEAYRYLGLIASRMNQPECAPGEEKPAPSHGDQAPSSVFEHSYSSPIGADFNRNSQQLPFNPEMSGEPSDQPYKSVDKIESRPLLK